ncbi:hypothetical protein cypCar_00044219 [Cyprinus carpio]|nr:hypothetical protein cypCar_00044219 [Cyprinus carpio]
MFQDISRRIYRRAHCKPWSDQSGGLKGGDVSLRLEKLTLQDEGSYHCYVSGDREYDSREVALSISAVGESADIIEALRKYAVHFTIDRQHVHPKQRVSQDGKSMKDAPKNKYTGEAFPYKLYAFGAQKYSSGRHYWEVELTQENTPPKNYWIIGVMKEGSVVSRDRSALTPSRGFWFLCSDGPRGFHINTDPPVKLHLTPRPERLGVLFDYKNGQLSFYNVTERKHLLTISSRFSGSVVPLFNPGAGDQSELRILDCPKPVEPAVESSQPLLSPVSTPDESSTVQHAKHKQKTKKQKNKSVILSTLDET